MSVEKPFEAPTLLTTKEVAEILKVSEQTVWRLCWEGKIPSVKIGHARRVRWSDLARVIATATSSAEAGPRETGARAEPSGTPGERRKPTTARRGVLQRAQRLSRRLEKRHGRMESSKSILDEARGERAERFGGR